MSSLVVVRWAGYDGRTRLSDKEYYRLLEVGFQRLADQASTVEAARALIPDGPVGFKTNCLTGRFNSTPVSLCTALGDLLIASGHAENDIVIWERTSRELSNAGFKLNASTRGRRCMGTDTAGIGYSREFYSSNDVNSLVSRIITETVSSSLNLPVLKDHSIAGLSGGMKNMYGAIHNPNKYHDNCCDPYCADVSNLEPIKTKHRLTICTAERVQYNGGPGYLAGFVDPYGGLILSADPVAADRVGLDIVATLRERHKLPPLAEEKRQPHYIETAAARGLGVADLNKIDMVVLAVDNSNVKTGELI